MGHLVRYILDVVDEYQVEDVIISGCRVHMSHPSTHADSRKNYPDLNGAVNSVQSNVNKLKPPALIAKTDGSDPS